MSPSTASRFTAASTSTAHHVNGASATSARRVASPSAPASRINGATPGSPATPASAAFLDSESRRSAAFSWTGDRAMSRAIGAGGDRGTALFACCAASCLIVGAVGLLINRLAPDATSLDGLLIVGCFYALLGISHRPSEGARAR